MKEEFDQLCAASETAGPCTEKQIADAERELKIRFPSQYRSFLSEYGAVVTNGVELYRLPGIGADEMPLWQDVVKVSKQLVDWGQAGSENQSFVPITEDGTGVYFYLDTSSAPKTKIVAVGAGIEKTVSSDLFEFVVQMSKGQVTV
ncbi:SMI1/KNR4 family protein [Roseobacter sp. HKCCD9010]|uniref:SMI1/KNR4 family protein n=1 Tax=unclassified Roseobacter TaxID=196798 RepID=UPI001490F7ED|nr:MULTISPECIES: SMI1/KNR4 family protein [unclassified Roseobacter]MBF9052309.1 SMI1/KNR4 family protein [Rhodobacterales bacterium HKCCD4356]NNV14276.1 SMI1/KNR4 family protein [Roseobacter sp. HKCCD7357]NNV18469.1 SMI1/KNR4 family protein [Roseobacter sp. HKCCD8768]NNV27909.1 SMI1/KNR4 family protein [Roseobacter sp. HKCCD8192]NNV32201.1 SMI1/KNR4 family protein [Roseobacter sp. HKCCD9061]